MNITNAIRMIPEKSWGNQEWLPASGVLKNGQDLLCKDSPKSQRPKEHFQGRF
jgi:hypothetical protein